MVTKTQGSYQARYNYRFGDKLKDVTSNFPGEAATVYYNYDGLGKRRCKTLDLATATWWRWDLGWNPIQEYTDPDADWDIENLAATFVPGLAEIPGGNPSTGSYRYYMGDHLGSVRTMRDQNKASLASYEFMPYGETYTQSGRELYRGFTGHTIDKDDGLYYAPYRYYSPVASRWLTRDPLGMVDGPNLYLYCDDYPVGVRDILGLTIKEECEWQYEADQEVCRNLPNKTGKDKARRQLCWSLAMARYAACLAKVGLECLLSPIPIPKPDPMPLPSCPIPLFCDLKKQ